MAKAKTKQAAGDPLALAIFDKLDPGFTPLGPITRTEKSATLTAERWTYHNLPNGTRGASQETIEITATVKRGKIHISIDR